MKLRTKSWICWITAIMEGEFKTVCTNSIKSEFRSKIEIFEK